VIGGLSKSGEGRPVTNILMFRRRLRDRVELLHAPDRDGVWIYRLDHISGSGRSHIGDYDDVAVAYITAMAFRRRDVPTVAIEAAAP
jgi:hypothetical protein